MFVGIDLGTSSVKTILIDENQKTLSTHTENIELLNPQIGFYEQDPENWYEATGLKILDYAEGCIEAYPEGCHDLVLLRKP